MSTKPTDEKIVDESKIEVIAPPNHLPAAPAPIGRGKPGRKWWFLASLVAAAIVLSSSLFESRKGPVPDLGPEIVAASMLGPAMGQPGGAGTFYIKSAVLTSGSGNWSVPADALGPTRVYAWGPGGSGTGALGASGPTPGAGGGSGALCIHTSQVVTAGASVAYVVATAGSATTILGGTANTGTNASGNTPGSGGTASGCDTNVSGSSGSAGVTASTASEANSASNGSAGTNCTGNGGKGGFGVRISQNILAGGGGAGAPCPSDLAMLGGSGADGANGISGSNPVEQNGANGNVPGGGGSGGSARVGVTDTGGGTGAAGLIVIFYAASTP